MPASWYELFSRNMSVLHLPAPEVLFATPMIGWQNIKKLAGVVRAKGMRVTFSQLLQDSSDALISQASRVALTRLATFAGAVTVAFYVGACIGSALNATQEKIWGQTAGSPPIQLTEADIAYLIAQRKIDVQFDTAREIAHQFNRLRHTPTGAFGRTTAGSR